MINKHSVNLRKTEIKKESNIKNLIPMDRLANILNWSKNNLKLLSIILALIIIFIGIGYFSINKKTETQKITDKTAPEQEIKEAKKVENFSRATFFLTSPIKGSLAMPASWEGRYRMEDRGSVMNFKYIGNSEIIADLFSIKTYTKEDWEKKDVKEGVLILEKEGFVFIYSKATDNPYTGEASEKFLKMQNEADEIIKSFKGFKL